MMKIDNKLIKNLANVANVTSTIFGGSVFTHIRKIREEGQLKLEMKAPSINADDIRAEINGDQLYIFQMIEIGQVKLPNVLGTIKLAENVLLDDVTASHEDGRLTLVLPVDNMAGFSNYHRNIDIDKF